MTGGGGLEHFFLYHSLTSLTFVHTYFRVKLVFNWNRPPRSWSQQQIPVVGPFLSVGSQYFPGDSQAHFLPEPHALGHSFPKMEIPALRDGAHRPHPEKQCCFLISQWEIGMSRGGQEIHQELWEALGTQEVGIWSEHLGV